MLHYEDHAAFMMQGVIAHHVAQQSPRVMLDDDDHTFEDDNTAAASIDDVELLLLLENATFSELVDEEWYGEVTQIMIDEAYADLGVL